METLSPGVWGRRVRVGGAGEVDVKCRVSQWCEQARASLKKNPATDEKKKFAAVLLRRHVVAASGGEGLPFVGWSNFLEKRLGD